MVRAQPGRDNFYGGWAVKVETGARMYDGDENDYLRDAGIFSVKRFASLSEINL